VPWSCRGRCIDVAQSASVAGVPSAAAVEEGELLARQLYHQSSQVVAASADSSPTLLQRRTRRSAPCSKDGGTRTRRLRPPSSIHRIALATADRSSRARSSRRGGLERVKGCGRCGPSPPCCGSRRLRGASSDRMGERPSDRAVGVSTEPPPEELAPVGRSTASACRRRPADSSSVVGTGRRYMSCSPQEDSRRDGAPWADVSPALLT